MATIKNYLNLRKFGIALLGFYCLIRGVAYLPITNNGPNGLPSGLDLISEIIPLEAWAGAWITVGIICIVKTFKKDEGIAVPLATGLMFGWGFFYLAGWFFDLYYGTDSRSWLTASSYIIPAMVIGIFSAQGGDRIELGSNDKIDN